MSLIVITEHNENIFDIIKKSPEPVIKIPRYKSKFRETIKEAVRNDPAKKCHGTMGLAEEIPPNPSDFLKKGTGHKPIPPLKSKKEQQPSKEINRGYSTKAEMEAYNKRLEELKKNRKNFVVGNIKNAVKMKPKDYKPNMLKPLIKNEGFGKVPGYLKEFVGEREKCEQAKKDVVGTDKPPCDYITREDREKLLHGLKENWEELQKQYQGLPILTDTTPKINRKLKLEKLLNQLEKDIVLLERHPFIYVYEDDE